MWCGTRAPGGLVCKTSDAGETSPRMSLFAIASCNDVSLDLGVGGVGGVPTRHHAFVERPWRPQYNRMGLTFRKQRG